jgi:epoxyqueuosine reductase
MTTSTDTNLSLLIKLKAYETGFDLCGLAPSKNLKEHEAIIKNWSSSGMNGEMHYLGRNIDKRINPDILFPGAKSVIVTGLNYFPEKKQGGNGIPIISKYSYGKNYHYVIKGKLNRILDYIKNIRPDADGKSFVDSAPVIEKAWAREAGLGWPGRHSIIINEKIGSFFFIGVIILNIELDYDQPFTEDHCGSCRLCVDSCPTKAINENRTIDVRRCISYLTVESRAPVPEEIVPKIGGRVFGCDKCQEVCPWNKVAKAHKTTEFDLPAEVERMSVKDWINLTSEQFNKLFKKSPISRRTYQRFLGNIEIAARSTG